MDLMQPMDPILKEKIPDGNVWAHQIKWDGVRGLVYLKSGDFCIFTKRGNERTGFYPELEVLPRLTKGHDLTLDGELIVLNSEGRPSFSHILMRERVRSKERLKQYVQSYPVLYVVFDVLSLDGQDLRKEPLSHRQEVLRTHLQKSPNVAITDDFEDGEALFGMMKDKNYEGIVSKRLDSPYIAGKKHDAWYKIKIQKKILGVIGGIEFKNQYPNSLMVGIWRSGQLEYIGSVAIGLKSKDFETLKQVAKALKRDENPFGNVTTKAPVVWVEPSITCYIHFMEWTDSGSIRHPRIIGFSSEKSEAADGKEYTDE